MIGVFVLITLLFAIRLYYLQIRQSDYYRLQADRQYTVPNSGLFARGSIFFTTKTGDLVSAASTKSGFRLAIIPAELTAPDRALSQITTIVPDIDREKFLASAAKTSDPYEEIAHRLTQDQADAIRELGLDGVRLYRENWRVYPSAATAAHVIGFTAYSENGAEGKYGLERSYENILRRTDSDTYINFFAEIFADLSETITHDGKEGDIVTTIEPAVQINLEQELAAIQSKWNSASSGAIVIDPQTGEIVAMASLPNFDLNTFNQVDSVAIYRNPLVENVHELGSIIKPLIVAAGLDLGMITAETSYDDKGYVTVGDRTIYNYDKEGRGPGTTVQGILNESLNTGMVFIGQILGKSNIKDYIERYGLTEKTNIDLPGEATNLTSNLKSNRDVEYANISFGQGIALTPISMVRALSTMANGGHLITPHVVKEIRYTDTTKKELSYEPKETILKPGTTEEISRMLVEVVDSTLAGGREKLANYSIAAKTGTAQIPNPAGGYYGDRNLHSFFGYFPAYDPEFLVFFYTVHPKGVKYSSQTLTTPFFNTVKFLINYYNVEPDR